MKLFVFGLLVAVGCNAAPLMTVNPWMLTNGGVWPWLGTQGRMSRMIDDVLPPFLPVVGGIDNGLLMTEEGITGTGRVGKDLHTFGVGSNFNLIPTFWGGLGGIDRIGRELHGIPTFVNGFGGFGGINEQVNIVPRFWQGIQRFGRVLRDIPVFLNAVEGIGSVGRNLDTIPTFWTGGIGRVSRDLDLGVGNVGPINWPVWSDLFDVTRFFTEFEPNTRIGKTFHGVPARYVINPVYTGRVYDYLRRLHDEINQFGRVDMSHYVWEPVWFIRIIRDVVPPALPHVESNIVFNPDVVGHPVAAPPHVIVTPPQQPVVVQPPHVVVEPPQVVVNPPHVVDVPQVPVGVLPPSIQLGPGPVVVDGTGVGVAVGQVGVGVVQGHASNEVSHSASSSSSSVSSSSSSSSSGVSGVSAVSGVSSVVV